MLFTPGVFALVCSSFLLSFITTISIVVALGVVFGWDPNDGGAHQLRRERRGLLIEAILKLVLWCELASLFFFVLIADRIHHQLGGAMCAAGTLNANEFGYPALWAKSAAFGLCSVWLILTRVGSTSNTKGLVRLKHAFLFVIWGILLAESTLQYRFFSNLNPDILTSCCATVFSDDGLGIASNIAASPDWAGMTAFFPLVVVTLTTGWCVTFRGASPLLFSTLSCLLGLVGAVAVISWVAPAYYELPTHHCPFCLLGPSVGWVGYPLLGSLSIAIILGVSVSIVKAARHLDPANIVHAQAEGRLCAASMLSFTIFAALTIFPIIISKLRFNGG